MVLFFTWEHRVFRHFHFDRLKDSFHIGDTICARYLVQMFQFFREFGFLAGTLFPEVFFRIRNRRLYFERTFRFKDTLAS